MTQKKRPERHGLSASTIGILMTGALICLAMSLVFQGGGSDESGFGYDAYEGPVMPLTSVSGAEGLTASRDVNFDLSGYEEIYEFDYVYPATVLITDTYRLTNHTDTDKELQLAYPFKLQTYMPESYYPAVTVAGVQTEAVLYPSLDSGSFYLARSFERYREWVEEQDPLTRAMEPPVVADIPVKAYHFTDIRYTGEEGKDRAYLTLNFSIPKGVNVWVYSHNGLEAGKEPGSYTMLFRDNFDEWDAGWLFVSGGDIENLTFGGNLGTYITPNSGLEGVTCEYEIVETTFAELMWKFAQEYDYWDEDSREEAHDVVTPEVLYRDTMKRIGGDMGEGYDPMFGSAVTRVADQFPSTFLQTRQMYMVFPATIPAGQTLEIQVRYQKEASRDQLNFLESYEIATSLGSDLIFTELTAGIQNTQWIHLEPRDIPFDLEAGVTQVTLDPQQDHYRLTLFHKKYLDKQ